MDWPLVIVVLFIFFLIMGGIIILMMQLGFPFSLGMGVGMILYHLGRSEN